MHSFEYLARGFEHLRHKLLQSVKTKCQTLTFIFCTRENL